MRRAEDHHIQAKRIVPPVVKGCGSEHAEAAPRGNKGAEGPAKAPNLYRILAESAVSRKRRVQDQVRAGEACDHGSKLDREVSRSPKCISSDSDVPRNIPIKTERGGRHGNQRRPDI